MKHDCFNLIQPVFQTAASVSSRIVGACVATLSDFRGLRLPSTVSKYQIVLVPILAKDCNIELTFVTLREVEKRLHSHGFRAHADLRFGKKNVEKYYTWEARGVPLIISVGKTELESKVMTVKGRSSFEKSTLPLDFSHQDIEQLLQKEDLTLKESILSRIEVIESTSLTELTSLFDSEKIKGQPQSTDPKLRRKQQQEFDMKVITQAPLMIVVAPIHYDSSSTDTITTLHQQNEKFYKNCSAEFRGCVSFADVDETNSVLCDRFPNIFKQDTSQKKCIITGKPANSWMVVSRY